MKYKCIIVDDEPLARKGIKLHLNDIESLELLEEFGNAIQAAEYLRQHPVDIIFLDIQMPGMTGMEFLQSVTTRPAVILTTAYTEHAIEAFELDVIDYLLKPIRFDRFYKAVTKAQDYISLKTNEPATLEKFEPDYIYIKSDRKYVKLKYTDIRFIQGMKDYVMIHSYQKKYMTAMNIKTILTQLPEATFSRVSKSYIINVNLIDTIDQDMIYIGEDDIPLGLSYKEAFLSMHIKDKLLKR